MDKKTMIAAVALVMLLISSNEFTRVESQGIDCLDSCTTGCVNSDHRRAELHGRVVSHVKP